MYLFETFEKYQFLFKYKKADNFNHPREIGFAFHGAGAGIGKRGCFAKVSTCRIRKLDLYIRQIPGLQN